MNGISRIRVPVSAAIALATAGAIGGMPISPMPVGRNVLGRTTTSVSWRHRPAVPTAGDTSVCADAHWAHQWPRDSRRGPTLRSPPCGHQCAQPRQFPRAEGSLNPATPDVFGITERCSRCAVRGRPHRVLSSDLTRPAEPIGSVRRSLGPVRALHPYSYSCSRA
jgi:hypothetical protein